MVERKKTPQPVTTAFRVMVPEAERAGVDIGNYVLIVNPQTVSQTDLLTDLPRAKVLSGFRLNIPKSQRGRIKEFGWVHIKNTGKKTIEIQNNGKGEFVVIEVTPAEPPTTRRRRLGGAWR